jgi:ADP-ribose pyrophosphatase YjhB (NUDIX family)
MTPHEEPAAVGKALADYVHPSIAVDTAVLTVDAGRLMVALLNDVDTRPRLPGTFVREGELLADAVRRSLLQKLRVTGLSPKQLHVFDDPNRDPRGWVFSVAHIAVVPVSQLVDVPLTPVDEARSLAFDHDPMLAMAVAQLRADYAEHPDPWHLLETFTLRELRKLHEAIDPDTLMRDSFRRLMEPQLIDTGRMTIGSIGKPSRVFRRATVAEQISREFDGRSRASFSPSARASSRTASRPSSELSLSLSDGARDFAVELVWNSRKVDRRVALTEGEAHRAFLSLVTKLTQLQDQFVGDDTPRKLLIVSGSGETVELHRF